MVRIRTDEGEEKRKIYQKAVLRRKYSDFDSWYGVILYSFVHSAKRTASQGNLCSVLQDSRSPENYTNNGRRDYFQTLKE